MTGLLDHFRYVKFDKRIRSSSSASSPRTECWRALRCRWQKYADWTQAASRTRPHAHVHPVVLGFPSWKRVGDYGGSMVGTHEELRVRQYLDPINGCTVLAGATFERVPMPWLQMAGIRAVICNCRGDEHCEEQRQSDQRNLLPYDHRLALSVARSTRRVVPSSKRLPCQRIRLHGYPWYRAASSRRESRACLMLAYAPVPQRSGDRNPLPRLRRAGYGDDAVSRN